MKAEPFNAARARTRYALPMWVDAFDRDTRHLTAEQVGAYMLILHAMWTRESCDLMVDDNILAAICRTSKTMWLRKMKPVLWPLMVEEGTTLYSPRLKKEAVFVEKYLQSQSDKKKVNPPAKALKNNNPKPSGDPSGGIPQTHPTYEPNNLSEGSAELDKSNSPPPSSAAAEIVTDQFLGMLAKAVGYPETPPGWQTKASRAVIATWFGSGLKQIEVLRRAKASRSVHPEPPATVQALASFMGPSTRRASEPPAAEADIIAHWVKTLNGPGYVPQSAIKPTLARQIIATGLVNADRLKSRGIAF